MGLHIGLNDIKVFCCKIKHDILFVSCRTKAIKSDELLSVVRAPRNIWSDPLIIRCGWNVCLPVNCVFFQESYDTVICNRYICSAEGETKQKHWVLIRRKSTSICKVSIYVGVIGHKMLLFQNINCLSKRIQSSTFCFRKSMELLHFDSSLQSFRKICKEEALNILLGYDQICAIILHVVKEVISDTGLINKKLFFIDHSRNNLSLFQ